MDDPGVDPGEDDGATLGLPPRRAPADGDGSTLADATGATAVFGSPTLGAGGTTPIDPAAATVDAPGTAGRPRRGVLPTIDGYEIRGELGRGGMGIVYLAREIGLNRPCALKMVLAGGLAAPVALARFRGEAEAVARLRHPNVVQIHHVGEAEGLPFFEMELVDGGSLAAAIDGTPWSARRAVAMVEPLARALAAAHAQEILHRDVKPGNVLLAADGTPKLIDFGLAKALGTDSGLTRTDTILGSPSYMAPEQAGGHAHEVGPRADVYALGAVLYELLTGRPPFRGASALETLEQVRSTEPVAPRRLVPGVPRDAETIALKCLQKEPSRRYASAAALADDLRRFRDGEPILARPVPFWERGWKWARRRPTIAALVAALVVVVGSTLGLGVISYLQIRAALLDTRYAKERASLAYNQETLALNVALRERAKADKASAAALAETYRASLSEARALRAARAPGWRAAALPSLFRLATLPTPRRDLAELRTEAVANLGTPDIRPTARFEGLSGEVRSLDFSPDGSTLATADQAGTLLLWDLASLRPRVTVRVDIDNRAWSRWDRLIRYLPDGTLACCTRDEGVVYLGPDGTRSPRPPIRSGVARPIGLSVDRRGERIAVAWDDATVTVCQVTDGQILRRVDGYSGDALAISPDGRTLALGEPAHVHLFAVDDQGPPIPLGSGRSEDRELEFAPDGKTLACASTDGTTTLWDLPGRTERFVLRGHREGVFDVAYSDDGTWLATTSNDHTTRVWDAATGQAIAMLPGPWFMTTVRFSPDGRSLAAGSTLGTVDLYELSGRREQRRLVGHSRGVQCLAPHPTAPILASGADDHRLIVWDPADGRTLHRWPTNQPSFVGALAYSPDGSTLAYGNGSRDADNTIGLIDAETGALHRVFEGHDGGIHGLAFDGDGRRLASGDETGAVKVWDCATGELLASFDAGNSTIWSLVFLDGDRRLLASVWNGDLVEYDLEGGAPPRRVPVPGRLRRFVADPRRGRIYLAGNDGSIAVRSLPDLAEIARIEGAHRAEVESLAVSPDGRLLATGSRDRQIIVRDAETLRPLFNLPDWSGIVKDLAFLVDGRLAIAGADSDVVVWDLGLVRDQLAAGGLAWDQPPPAVADSAELAESIAPPVVPTVPVIRPTGLDPAEVARMQERLRAGIAAFEERRMADAVAALADAGDRCRSLLAATPGQPELLGRLTVILAFLGGALRDTGQTAEALNVYEEARGHVESLREPTGIDLYNLACVYAQIAALEGTSSNADRLETLETAAVAALRRSVEGGFDRFDAMDADADLDPLRDRADFAALMLDRRFPAQPFDAP